MLRTGAGDIGDLLSMKEVPYTISHTSPDGKRETIEARARTGPRIMGHNATSIIVPSRADKPRYSLRPEFTIDDIELLLKEDGRLLQEGNLEAIVGRLRQLRAERQLANCVFCYPRVEQATPKPRIYHEGLYTESGRQVITFPNKSPFEPGHVLTVFADHKTDLGQLTYNDVVNYFLSLQQLAQIFKREGAIGIVDFMNFGEDAAASVYHPHAQRGKMIEGMENRYRQTKVASLFQGSNGNMKELMDGMINIIRSGDLYVFENEHIFVWAVYSPTSPDQTEVIFKNAGNILDFSDQELRTAARSMLGVIHGLRLYRGVTDINLSLYQSNFKDGDNGFRMRAVIDPRNKNKHGGIEVRHGVYVVPTLPEETARELVKHYERKS